MSNLKKIKKVFKSGIDNENVNSVSAREIHEYLEIKTRFNDWIRRAIEKYDFIKDEDYIMVTHKRVTKKRGGNKKDITDYMVTIDMAKKLVMLENNPKGKKIRKYFISIEKDYNKKNHSIRNYIRRHDIQKDFPSPLLTLPRPNGSDNMDHFLNSDEAIEYEKLKVESFKLRNKCFKLKDEFLAYKKLQDENSKLRALSFKLRDKLLENKKLKIDNSKLKDELLELQIKTIQVQAKTIELLKAKEN